MSLDAKLLNAGLVLVVLVPVAILFFRRWRRGGLRYGGLWMPRPVIERGARTARRGTEGAAAPDEP